MIEPEWVEAGCGAIGVLMGKVCGEEATLNIKLSRQLTAALYCRLICSAHMEMSSMERLSVADGEFRKDSADSRKRSLRVQFSAWTELVNQWVYTLFEFTSPINLRIYSLPNQTSYMLFT